MSLWKVSQRLFSSYSKTGIHFNSFKSSIALEKLYPNSTLNITKTPNIPQNGAATFSGYIPMGKDFKYIDKLKISYCRSSGPGGQNVNVLSTKVEVRFHLDSADWIPESIRNIIKSKGRSWITKDGFIFITSDRTRHQHMNVADALEKLREFIRSCEPVVAAEPSPETVELHRKRAEKAARARLRQKRERNSVKGSRGAASGDF